MCLKTRAEARPPYQRIRPASPLSLSLSGIPRLLTFNGDPSHFSSNPHGFSLLRFVLEDREVEFRFSTGRAILSPSTVLRPGFVSVFSKNLDRRRRKRIDRGIRKARLTGGKIREREREKGIPFSLLLNFRGILKRGRKRERGRYIRRGVEEREKAYALHAKYKRRDGWWMAWRGAARCMPTPSCMEQSFALVLPTEGSLAPPPVAGCT